MQIVSATRFKQLNRNRRSTGAAIAVRKQIIAPPDTIESDKRVLRFTISTGAVDRERDAIAVAGWELKAYRDNPVVLWGHDGDRLPIGRAFDVAVEGGSLKASVEFVPEDLPEGGAFAESVYRLARGGFLAATSVGFRPLKWDFTDDKDRGGDDWFPGIDFEEQELVEFSIVTVPANPEALIEVPPVTASDTPSASGEELTSLTVPLLRGSIDRDFLNEIQTELAAKIINEEQARARARRRRVFQLAMAMAD